MRPLIWYLHRLRAMDAAELLGRARDKLRRKTERIALGALRDVSLGKAAGNVPALPAKADAPAALREILAVDAAKLLAGRWTLFGWSDVNVSLPPNWHRDYTRGVDVPSDRRNPDHRALPGGADARAVWEINRWAEMTRLAMHGWLNDDAEAIVRAQEWLADWMDGNPPGRGINWTSALEAALRLVNFCWFDALVSNLADGGGRIGEEQRRIRDAVVPAHVWWVRRYLSFGSSANNHRLGELTGLLLAVKRWSGLEGIAGSPDALWQEIADCVLAQFGHDGGNREQALHYHLFAFEMALHACRAMNVAEGPAISRLQRAAEFFIRMSHPREPWDYGDGDDAQMVPLTMRRGKAGAEWGAWMSGTHAGEATALSYWLGDAAVCGPRAAIRGRDWWIAEESGMAVIERDGWKVRVDASPLGFGTMAAHGHCDALHVSIWDGDDALVIDPGTGGYFGSGRLRAELASWNAHNGPQPAGGFKTPRRIGTFLWSEPHVKPMLCSKDGTLTGRFSHEGVIFTRAISLDGGRMIVQDSGSAGAPFQSRWYLSPECRVEDLGRGQVRIVRGSRSWLAAVDQGNASVGIESRPASRSFGSIEQTAVLVVTGSSSIRFVLRKT